MSSVGLAGRIAVFAGGAAIVVMGALTSCSASSDEAEEAPVTDQSESDPETGSPTTSTSEESATEESPEPDYEGSFTPAVDPTPPSAVCEDVINGVCQR